MLDGQSYLYDADSASCTSDVISGCATREPRFRAGEVVARRDRAFG